MKISRVCKKCFGGISKKFHVFEVVQKLLCFFKENTRSSMTVGYLRVFQEVFKGDQAPFKGL